LFFKSLVRFNGELISIRHPDGSPEKPQVDLERAVLQEDSMGIIDLPADYQVTAAESQLKPIEVPKLSRKQLEAEQTRKTDSQIKKIDELLKKCYQIHQNELLGRRSLA
jgi:hypothetical protein